MGCFLSAIGGSLQVIEMNRKLGKKYKGAVNWILRLFLGIIALVIISTLLIGGPKTWALAQNLIFGGACRLGICPAVEDAFTDAVQLSFDRCRLGCEKLRTYVNLQVALGGKNPKTLFCDNVPGELKQDIDNDGTADQICGQTSKDWPVELLDFQSSNEYSGFSFSKTSPECVFVFPTPPGFREPLVRPVQWIFIETADGQTGDCDAYFPAVPGALISSFDITANNFYVWTDYSRSIFKILTGEGSDRTYTYAWINPQYIRVFGVNVETAPVTLLEDRAPLDSHKYRVVVVGIEQDFIISFNIFGVPPKIHFSLTAVDVGSKTITFDTIALDSPCCSDYEKKTIRVGPHPFEITFAGSLSINQKIFKLNYLGTLATCSDSDGPDAYGTKGTCDDTTQSIVDSCSGVALEEAYCTASAVCQKKLVGCSSWCSNQGYDDGVCSDGACVCFNIPEQR